MKCRQASSVVMKQIFEGLCKWLKGREIFFPAVPPESLALVVFDRRSLDVEKASARDQQPATKRS